MTRVTFDCDYIGNLEDYYQRNECIREQQYLSHDKLLHLAAFCLSKVAVGFDEDENTHVSGPKAEAALDAIRQLSALCRNSELADAKIKRSTVVNGETNEERQNRKRHVTTSESPTSAERSMVRPLRWRAAAGSAIRALAERLGIRTKTTHFRSTIGEQNDESSSEGQNDCGVYAQR